MQSIRLADDSYLLVLASGDRLPDELIEFARTQHVSAGWVTAIGAFREATIAYWNAETLEYERSSIDEQVEVVSLIGNLSLDDGSPKLHAHVTLGMKTGAAHAGHLMAATAHPTLEVLLKTFAAPLHRKQDRQTGLTLLAGP